MYMELSQDIRQLPDSARNAKHTWSDRPYARVLLIAQDGTCGHGEASPLPGYSSDTLEQALESLRSAPLASLPEHAPDAVADFLTQLQARWQATPAARFALETALLALWARQKSVPPRALFGCSATRYCAGRALLFSLLPLATMKLRARALVSAGEHTLKVKLGLIDDWRAEHAALLVLRAAVGDRVSLRFDVNGAWTLQQAERRLPALRELRPELVEEPVPAADLLSLTPPGFALALDESLQHPDALQLVARASARGLCQALVLKPMTLGGFSGCLAWSARARACGLDTLVTHTFDGPAAQAAACELALVLECQRAVGLPEPLSFERAFARR